jgi:N-acyl-D-aspartate/D-glutamate deacylase
MASERAIGIRCGTIIDGNGGAPFVGDVMVKDGRVAEMGNVSLADLDDIEADGLSVTLGFNNRNHCDSTGDAEFRRASSCWNGVIPVVMGNCGVGLAPSERTRGADCGDTHGAS